MFALQLAWRRTAVGSMFKGVGSKRLEFKRAVERAQLQDETDNAFVRRVAEVPHPVALLANDHQMRLMVQCCCETPHPLNKPLGLDPTFKLGMFIVHLMFNLGLIIC